MQTDGRIGRLIAAAVATLACACASPEPRVEGARSEMSTSPPEPGDSPAVAMKPVPERLRTFESLVGRRTPGSHRLPTCEEAWRRVEFSRLAKRGYRCGNLDIRGRWDAVSATVILDAKHHSPKRVALASVEVPYDRSTAAFREFNRLFDHYYYRRNCSLEQNREGASYFQCEKFRWSVSRKDGGSGSSLKMHFGSTHFHWIERRLPGPAIGTDR